MKPNSSGTANRMHVAAFQATWKRMRMLSAENLHLGNFTLREHVDTLPSELSSCFTSFPKRSEVSGGNNRMVPGH